MSLSYGRRAYRAELDAKLEMLDAIALKFLALTRSDLLFSRFSHDAASRPDYWDSIAMDADRSISLYRYEQKYSWADT